MGISRRLITFFELRNWNRSPAPRTRIWISDWASCADRTSERRSSRYELVPCFEELQYSRLGCEEYSRMRLDLKGYFASGSSRSSPT